MAYEHENEISSLIIDNPSEIDGYAYDEIKKVYRKARAWDRMYDMILDEDMTIREFDDEMYKLLKQTGKTNIRIITDPSIRMEDE